MADLEDKLNVSSFFVLDENFLLHKERSLALLELMKQHNKSWALFVFSSAGVLRSYTIEQLVELGITWVWMGLEGKKSQYNKLAGIDTVSLVEDLQDHGIRVLGSSIIGLEEHTPDNIAEVVDYATSHPVDFHQFMLYTANQGTPLYSELREKGSLLPPEEFKVSDSHGQFRFNHRHTHIPAGDEEQYLINAFRQDFEKNGPSLFRLIGTILKGWQRYQNESDPRIRTRYKTDVKPLRSMYAGAVWAMKKWYKEDAVLCQKLDELLHDIYGTFGLQPRIIAPVAGRYIYWAMKKEEKRLAAGWTLEPSTFLEKNEAATSATMMKESTVKPLVSTNLVDDLVELRKPVRGQ
jgi:hypothetical protein